MWKQSEKFLLNDKFIGPLIKKWGHCTIKPIKKSMYFENLVNAICSQQLSGKAAETIFFRVKKLLIKITPDRILKTEDLKLREQGLSWQKVAYVKDLANRVNSEELMIFRSAIVNNLDKLSDEEILKTLRIPLKSLNYYRKNMMLYVETTEFKLAQP